MQLSRWLTVLRTLLFDDTSDNQKSIGNRGEKVARNFLKKKGWILLSSNLRVGQGEIDIIALSPSQDIFAIVEVRTTARQNGNPEATVTQRKMRAMKLAAKRFAHQAQRYNCKLRVDIITVRLHHSGHKIKHYKGVMRI